MKGPGKLNTSVPNCSQPISISLIGLSRNIATDISNWTGEQNLLVKKKE